MYIRFVENVLKNLRFVNVNNMKQTPIPEKIDPYCKVSGDHFNDLIDVLTEQDKEIEDQEGQIQELERRWADLLRRITKVEQKDFVGDSQPEQPYTAMRSTGEYCKCKEPHVTDSAGMDIVHCISCGKEPSPIKPQEDIEKFVDYSIKKYKKTYKALGNSQEDIREKIADLYVDSVCDDSKCRIRHMHKAAGLELADRILAIVKGE